MPKKHLIGVYCIKNTANNKVYVGSSIFGLNRRLTCHKSTLRNGTHHSPHLQASYKKHGPSAFKFFILEECDEASVAEREMFYIKKLKSCEYAHGFNRQRNVIQRKRKTDACRAASSARMRAFHSSRSPSEKKRLLEKMMDGRHITISFHRFLNERQPAFSLIAGPRF